VSAEETGTVKWFNIRRGLGFIVRDDGGKDVFVHISAFERSGLTGLSEGDRVILNITTGRKGLEAARVRLVSIAAYQFSSPVVSVSCSITNVTRRQIAAPA
jgi:CspA family cold shock protein